MIENAFDVLLKMHDSEFVWSASSNELEFSVEFLIRMIDNNKMIIEQ